MITTQQLSPGLSLMREGDQEWVVFDERHFGVMEPKQTQDEIDCYGDASFWKRINAGLNYFTTPKLPYRRLLSNLTSAQLDFVNAQRKGVECLHKELIQYPTDLSATCKHCGQLFVQPTERGDDKCDTTEAQYVPAASVGIKEKSLSSNPAGETKAGDFNEQLEDEITKIIRLGFRSYERNEVINIAKYFCNFGMGLIEPPPKPEALPLTGDAVQKWAESGADSDLVFSKKDIVKGILDTILVKHGIQYPTAWLGPLLLDVFQAGCNEWKKGQ